MYVRCDDTQTDRHADRQTHRQTDKHFDSQSPTVLRTGGQKKTF